MAYDAVNMADWQISEEAEKNMPTPEEWAEKDNPLEWITAEYTKAIEEFIREDPSQYWWLHRRWKHRPKNERAKT